MRVRRAVRQAEQLLDDDDLAAGLGEDVLDRGRPGVVADAVLHESFAWLISRATAALASNVCGSVFGLLMIESAFTYLPPTCEMTSAYSFSAPIAVMVMLDAAEAEAVEPEPDVPLDEDDDEQALASRTAASGSATRRHQCGFA